MDAYAADISGWAGNFLSNVIYFIQLKIWQCFYASADTLVSNRGGRGHRLATQDRVRLSDLKGEFFVSGDSQQLPGRDRRVEAYCKKYGKFRPKFLGPAQTLAHAFELIGNENAVLMLLPLASHHSLPGVVFLPQADPEVTWKIVVMWRRGRAGGALKALLDALFFAKGNSQN